MRRAATSARVDGWHRELRHRLRHRHLLRQRRRHGAGDLGVQEAALEILGRLLDPGRAERDGATSARAATRARHAEIVDAACAELGARLDGKLDLFGLAGRVGTSPFHLCRLFRAHTGLTLHRYHERLRLRLALQRILDGQDDLTALALELGFSHHSHFTERFRREFGRVPSGWR